MLNKNKGDEKGATSDQEVPRVLKSTKFEQIKDVPDLKDESELKDESDTKDGSELKKSFKETTNLSFKPASVDTLLQFTPKDDKIRDSGKMKKEADAEKEILVVNYDYSSSSTSSLNRSQVISKDVVFEVNDLFKALSLDRIDRTSLFLTRPSEIISKSLTISFLFLPSGESIVSKLHKTSKLLKDFTLSKGYILYLNDTSTNELFITSAKWQDFYKTRYGWKVDSAKTIATYVVRTKRGVIADMQLINLDYYNGLDIPNLFSSNVLSVPILNFQDRLIGVLDLYRINGVPYTQFDLHYVQYYLKWCGQSLHQNEECVLYEKYFEVVMKIMTDLELGFGFKFGRAEESESLQALYNILFFAKQTLNAESATLFLETNGVLYRELSTDILKDTLNGELRAQKELKIAKLTVTSLNPSQSFKDVYNDLRFDKEVDFKCERIIRSVLSSRFLREDRLTGVLQVVNKLIEDAFCSVDEQFMKYILPYISIWSQLENQNVSLRLAVIRNEIFMDIFKNQLCFEYNTKKLFDYENISLDDIPTDLEKSSFHPSAALAEYKIPQMVFYMIKSVCIKKVEALKPLYNFIQMVERCYEDEPLHNFEFAFNSLHSTYCLLKTQPDFFDNIEKFCIMIACLCSHISYQDYFKCSFKRCLTPFFADYRRNSKIPQNDWIVQFLLKSSGVLKAFQSDEENCLSCMIKELMTANNLHVAYENYKRLEFFKSNKILDIKSVEHRRLIRILTVSAGNIAVYNNPHNSYRKKYEAEFFSYYKLEPESDSMTTYIGFIKTIVAPIQKFMKYLFPSYEAVIYY